MLNHKSNNERVTEEEKKQRAKDIAEELGNNKHWLTHSRPISIEQLRELQLKVEDYSENADLREEINAYYRFLFDYILKYQLIIFMQTRKGVSR